MKRTLSALLLMGGAAAVWAGNGPSPADVQAIVKEGKERNQVMKRLRELTNIGPRLTGSPNLSKAQTWAVGQFKKFGLSNVALDKWGEVPVGFERGERQIGKMVAPFESEFVFTTPCWTPGTKGLVRGNAYRMPKTVAEVEAMKPKLKGAFIVMPEPVAMRGAPVAETDVSKALDEAGIAARISGSRNELVTSFGNWRDKTFEKRPTRTEIVVRKSDHERILRNIDLGRAPVLEFDIENKWIKGPVAQYNVVAELPGTDLKDEVVIVCGHLDSWNTPGSQGACDNGTGSVATIEAARILAASGVKPRRTIRFILWSGEEQGLLGSRSYVDRNKASIDNIVAVLNDDGGTNYQGGYVGLASQRSILEAAFAPTVAAFPELPMAFDTVAAPSGGGSSDHASFAQVGVPAYFTKESGRANYSFVWHTQNDRFEQAIPEYMVQSSTNHAVVAFHLASIDEKLARFPVRQPGSGTVALNHALAMGSDRMYGDPHFWNEDHGHDHDHEDDYVLEILDRLKRAGSAVLRLAHR